MAVIKRMAAAIALCLAAVVLLLPFCAFAAEDEPIEYLLLAEDADLWQAPDVILEPDESPYNLGGWLNGNIVDFPLDVYEDGYYTVELEYSKDEADGPVSIIISTDTGSELEAMLNPTASGWSEYVTWSAGELCISQDDTTLSIEAEDGDADGYVMNLRSVKLIEASDGALNGSDTGSSTINGSDLGLERRIYDGANILSDREEEYLNQLAVEASNTHEVHFAVLTLDDENVIDLEGYSWDFYQKTVSGVGGAYDCALMTINMGTRRVAVDFYGELRTMLSEHEASYLREGFTEQMTDGRYYDAAEYFINRSSELVGHTIASFRIDVPEADAADLVYDFAGALSEDELETLKRNAADISAKTGTAHIVLVLNDSFAGEYVHEDYLKRFSSSFYNQNIKSKSLYTGAFIAAVSCDSAKASASNFGSYDPENTVLWDITNEMSANLSFYSVFTACRVFLADCEDLWQAENLELSVIDPSRKIFDETNMLSEEQEDSLRVLIDEAREKTGTDFFITFSGYSTEKTLINYNIEWRQALAEYMDAHSGGKAVTLLIGRPPVAEGDWLYVFVDPSGTSVYRKMGANQTEELRGEVHWQIDVGKDPYAAAVDFVNGSVRYLSSPIPNVKMIDDIGWAIKWSFLIAVALAALSLMVLRIMHGFGLKRRFSAVNYLNEATFKLHYSNDIFLHSHTSSSRRSKSSDSGSGSSGSSGSSDSGHSSRSEGSF
ncbi:MAG: TPM domain-containing protein [Clostridiales bacterium]|jgi:uncharacterized membrane protein YgcG|nr:TPM domain-containing protein [Clostridiales bacterium]